jgi:riboflavin kinase/FMN adenylyltransferase
VVSLIRNLDDLPDALRGAAVAIGNFDGVHLGHARIIQRLTARAREIGAPPVVFTFDPHPAAILRPDAASPPLTATTRKTALLAQLGVEAVIAYPTDVALLRLQPRQFFDSVVVGRLGARAMAEGYNFTFGRDRSGDAATLERFCNEAGIVLEVVGPVEIGGQPVSSSRVRRLLEEGAVEEARGMLTAAYRLGGVVIRGAGRGRQLGYPTANLGGMDTLLPAGGIYAGRAEVEGRSWAAAISVGPNPTFGEGQWKVEVHLVDFQGWLYEQRLEVDFLARLRDIQRFGSVPDLIRQMDLDIAATRRIAAAV